MTIGNGMTFNAVEAIGQDYYINGVHKHRNEVCTLCNKEIEDGKDILKGESLYHKITRVVCEECAYAIHSAYEGSL